MCVYYASVLSSELYMYTSICVYVYANLSECMPRHFSRAPLAVFHTSVSTFSEGSLQQAAKESFHTVAVILLPLNASLCPADYGEIKNCSLASQKFIMSVAPLKVFAPEDVISCIFHGWESARLARAHWQAPPTVSKPRPCLNQWSWSLCKRTFVYSALEWAECRGARINLLYLSFAGCIRVHFSCGDPYTLCRPARWALMETKATGHSVSTPSSYCPAHCPCIAPWSGCEKEQCCLDSQLFLANLPRPKSWHVFFPHLVFLFFLLPLLVFFIFMLHCLCFVSVSKKD